LADLFPRHTYPSAIYKLLGTPSLETVGLYNVCLFFPVEAIGACPSLRFLAYFGDLKCYKTVGLAGPGPADLSYPLPSYTPGTRRPAVKYLFFNTATSKQLEKYLCSEACPLDITQLLSLTVSVHGNWEASLLAVQTLTMASSDTLTVLSWRFPWYPHAVGQSKLYFHLTFPTS